MVKLIWQGDTHSSCCYEQETIQHESAPVSKRKFSQTNVARDTQCCSYYDQEIKHESALVSTSSHAPFATVKSKNINATGIDVCFTCVQIFAME